jgi:succinoglycan biosynthesis protein ExoA
MGPLLQEARQVTVVVPVRDEETTVSAALESLARQTIGPESIEVLVYDGGSRDETRSVCADFATGRPWARFEVLENRGGTVPHALNAGLRDGRSPWFAVLAGRTVLSPNYLETCLAELEREGPSVGVGGRFVADAEGSVANAIAAVVSHPLGVGKGFRTETQEADLPHHPFAVWRREDVIRFGAFDPELARNQDDEFSMRAIGQGARIRLAPEAEIRYRPRERFRGLAVQYFQYGLWKSAVGRRYRLFPRRSAVPAIVAATAYTSVLLAAAGRTKRPLLTLAGCYACGGALAGTRGQANPLLAGVALAVVHLAYGTGVIAGALRPRLVSSTLGQSRTR